MAFKKKVLSRWLLIGVAWTVLWLCIGIYVTIPDAPWNYNLWWGLMLDPTCYYHELAVVLGVYLAGIAVIMATRLWLAARAIHDILKGLLERV